MVTRRIRAAPAGIGGKNNCCAPPQFLAGWSSCNDGSLFLRAHKPDAAADIPPARLRHQENPKWMNRASQWLCAKSPAMRATESPLVFRSTSPQVVRDESSHATSSRPHKCCRRREARLDPEAAL